MNRRWVAIGAVACTLALATSTAAQDAETPDAQQDDPRVVQARALFEEGREHFDDERFRLAAESFSQAHDLLSQAGSPMAGIILYNLATSLDELPDRQRDARDTYARFLAEAPGDNPQVQELVHTVEQRIRELDLRLAEQNTDTTTTTTAEDDGGSISPVGPILMASGGALLLVGSILGIVSLSQASDFEDACPALTGCPRELESDYDSMRTMSVAADILMIGGVVTAAVGAVLTFTLRTGGSEQAPEVGAFCDGDGCQAVARGAF